MNSTDVTPDVPNTGSAHPDLPATTVPLTFEEVSDAVGLARLRDSLSSAGAIQILLDSLELSETDGGAFVGREGQQIVVIAPRLRRRVGLPIRLGEKVLWRMDIRSARFLPCAREGVSSQDHAEALLRWLRNAQPDLALAFTDVLADTPLHEAVGGAESVGYRVLNNEPAPHLFHRFLGSYQEFFNQKPSKYKNQLRKNEKLFHARMGTAFALAEYRSLDDVVPFLQAADIINKKTYQYKLFGERVDNDAQTVAACTAASLKGRFRSFILWHEDTPLCFVLGHQGADGVFEHRQTGYDPHWRDCAPGINCNILTLQALYASNRPTLLDFGSGDADYKRLFANVTRMSASPLLVPRTARYLLPILLYSVASRVNRMAVATLERLGLKERIKRVIRRRP